jgi:hypothetical protein
MDHRPRCIQPHSLKKYDSEFTGRTRLLVQLCRQPMERNHSWLLLKLLRMLVCSKRLP